VPCVYINAIKFGTLLVKKRMVIFLVRYWAANRHDSLQESFGQAMYLALSSNVLQKSLNQIIVTDGKDVFFLSFFVLKKIK